MDELNLTTDNLPVEADPQEKKGDDGKQEIQVGCMIPQHNDRTAQLAHSERFWPPVSIAKAQIRPQQKVCDRIEDGILWFWFVRALLFHSFYKPIIS